MSWDDFWAYFKAHPEHQNKLLKQINLAEFLPNLSTKYQLEILNSAPQKIIQRVKKHLNTETLTMLGLKPKPLSKSLMRKLLS